MSREQINAWLADHFESMKKKLDEYFISNEGGIRLIKFENGSVYESEMKEYEHGKAEMKTKINGKEINRSFFVWECYHWEFVREEF